MMNKIIDIINNIDPNNWVIYALYFLTMLIIILVFYTLYTYIEEDYLKKEKIDFDINVASKALDKLEKKSVSNILPEEYEKAEEENAIISYDELIERTTSIPAIIESDISNEEEYEENVPITITEMENLANLKEVVSYNFSTKVVDEKEFLKELKKFRANLK